MSWGAGGQSFLEKALQGAVVGALGLAQYSGKGAQKGAGKSFGNKGDKGCGKGKKGNGKGSDQQATPTAQKKSEGDF